MNQVHLPPGSEDSPTDKPGFNLNTPRMSNNRKVSIVVKNPAGGIQGSFVVPVINAPPQYVYFGRVVLRVRGREESAGRWPDPHLRGPPPGASCSSRIRKSPLGQGVY